MCIRSEGKRVQFNIEGLITSAVGGAGVYLLTMDYPNGGRQDEKREWVMDLRRLKARIGSEEASFNKKLHSA